MKINAQPDFIEIEVIKQQQVAKSGIILTKPQYSDVWIGKVRTSTDEKYPVNSYVGFMNSGIRTMLIDGEVQLWLHTGQVFCSISDYTPTTLTEVESHLFVPDSIIQVPS